MDNRIKISYLVVTWNNQEIIEECLNSLLKFENKYDNQIIVVDNNSSDNTCKIIKENFSENVELIESSTNYGFSKANNIALKYAKGDYIFYVNPDVIFIEDIVSPMINILQNKSYVGIVSPCLVYRDKKYQVSTGNFPSISKLIFDDLQIYHLVPSKIKMKFAQAQYKNKQNRYVDWTYGAAHFCRYEDVNKIQGYPSDIFMYGEDTEFCMIFLKKLNQKTYYLGSSELIHIGGFSESKVINSKKVTYVTRSNLNFVKKYHNYMYYYIYKYLYLFVSLLKYLIFSIAAIFKNDLKISNGKIKWKNTAKTIFCDNEDVFENKIK